MLRTTTLILFLFATLTAQAQQAPLREFEVQQPAEPQGGIPTLQQFLAVNVRKPFMAQVANVKGFAVVQGVVETDGRISEVSILKSLRPDCDREAVRAFSLFNAWKPAQHEGKAVRQSVTFPVTFRASPPILYENGLAIQYFDNAFSVIASPDSAALRSETPTDTLGLPTGNMVFFQRDGKRWKREIEMRLFQNPIRESLGKRALLLIGHRDNQFRYFGHTYELDEQRHIYDETIYDINREPLLQIDRDSSGVVIGWKEHGTDRIQERVWHSNGQQKLSALRFKQKPLEPKPQPDQLLAFWSRNGAQRVTEGNGWFMDHRPHRSFRDTTQFSLLVERGRYENGLKQGNWMGKCADGSYWYEEEYQKGELVSGKATYADQPDTLRYTVVDQQPDFKGGKNALNMFLVQNIRYPANAQRNFRQGRVVIGFVVCTDGTLCDYTIVDSVDSLLDAEALRVVKAMTGQWKPGVERGRPVRVSYKMPISFRLE